MRQPKTERMIFRFGDPIPYPTTIEELREQLVWALGELHALTHVSQHRDTPLGSMTLDGTGSPSDRMAIALMDPRFDCPDAWHLTYQPGPPQGSKNCPTCDQHWIAMVGS